MARTLKNRVRETTVTTGAGAITPNGAVLRFRTFASAGLLANATVPYLIEVPSGPWEIGTGLYTATGTIQRTFEDSSTGALLSLTGEAGTTISIVASTAALLELTPLVATATTPGLVYPGPGGTLSITSGALDIVAVVAVNATVQPTVATLSVVLADATLMSGAQARIAIPPRVPVTTIAASGTAVTLTIPAGVGSVAYDIMLTAACTLTLAGGATGEEQRIRVYLRQDATAGRVVTLPTNVQGWAGGMVPTPNTVGGRIDVFQFTTPDGGVTWLGDF